MNNLYTNPPSKEILLDLARNAICDAEEGLKATGIVNPFALQLDGDNNLYIYVPVGTRFDLETKRTFAATLRQMAKQTRAVACLFLSSSNEIRIESSGDEGMERFKRWVAEHPDVDWSECHFGTVSNKLLVKVEVCGRAVFGMYPIVDKIVEWDQKDEGLIDKMREENPVEGLYNFSGLLPYNYEDFVQRAGNINSVEEAMKCRGI